ncbi:MAG: putative membrane protein YphA (DoxX/SURF4 family), partial [Limisphaerales bacterium]
MKLIVQLCRFLVGGLFIFSGLIKANDPVGFGVKLEDYFLVFAETIPFFGSDFMLGLTLILAWFICVIEVALGIALLLGMQRKSVAVSLFGMIIFFTWLTGFSALTGKVTDCGCFGDAIPLTPWESFYK